MRRSRGGSPDRGRRRSPVAVPPGADAGAEDGKDAHLLAGDRRVHEHQRDADPPRPVRVREVRQARGRLQHRLPAGRDPEDPPHSGPAQHRAHRRRSPRTGDRELADLRRARDQHRGRLRHRLGEARPSDRSRDGQRVRAPAGVRARQEHHRRRAGGPRIRRAARSRRPRRVGREDHLQLLGSAARDAGGRDGAHVEPGGGIALCPVFPPDLEQDRYPVPRCARNRVPAVVSGLAHPHLARVPPRRYGLERVHACARTRVEQRRARRHHRLPGAPPGALRHRRRARRRAGAARPAAARVRPRPLRGARGEAPAGPHARGARALRRRKRRRSARPASGRPRVREPRSARRAGRRRERRALRRQGARLRARVLDAWTPRARTLGSRGARRRRRDLRRLHAHPRGARRRGRSRRPCPRGAARCRRRGVRPRGPAAGLRAPAHGGGGRSAGRRRAAPGSRQRGPLRAGVRARRADGGLRRQADREQGSASSLRGAAGTRRPRRRRRLRRLPRDARVHRAAGDALYRRARAPVPSSPTAAVRRRRRPLDLPRGLRLGGRRGRGRGTSAGGRRALRPRRDRGGRGLRVSARAVAPHVLPDRRRGRAARAAARALRSAGRRAEGPRRRRPPGGRAQVELAGRGRALARAISYLGVACAADRPTNLFVVGDEQKVGYEELLAASRAAFEAVPDFTVAVEEEFALLDPATLELVNRFEDVRDAAKGTELEPHLVGELIASEVEVRTGRCDTFAEAAEKLGERRVQLRGLTDSLGVGLSSTGTHPWSRWQDQRIIDTPHYRRNDELLRYVVWRNNTFGLHVHVGINGADRAVQVNSALRNYLPELLALSSSSPFVEGVFTHLHSARTEIFTRMFPRCGIPDVFADWEEWESYVRFLYATGSVTEHTQIWWSVRPHLAFPTVEIRICDAQPELGEARSLAALSYSLAARIARALDEGEPLPSWPNRLLEENLWRAIRWR